jgi:hypothetical protein
MSYHNILKGGTGGGFWVYVAISGMRCIHSIVKLCLNIGILLINLFQGRRRTPPQLPLLLQFL